MLSFRLISRRCRRKLLSKALMSGVFQNRHVLNPFLLFSRMKIGQRKWRAMQRSKKPRASTSTLGAGQFTLLLGTKAKRS